MSKSAFTFGGPSSGNASSVFGSASNGSSSGPASSSIFGAPTTQAGSIFGTASTSSPTTSASSPFASIGGLTTAPSSGQSGTGGNSTIGSTWSFPSKPDEGKGGSASINSSFPTPNKPGTPSILGNTTLAPAGSTTPATSKLGVLFNFGTSTTPGGPPPTTETNTETKAPSSSLFGQKPVGPTSQTTGPTQQSASLFSGNTPSTSIFGSLGGPAPTSGPLFSILNSSKPASSSDTTTSIGSTTPVSKPAFSFPSLGAATSQPPTTTSSPFGALSTTSNTNSTLMASTAPAQSASTFGNPATTTAPTQSTGSLGNTATSTGGMAAGPNTSFFGGLGKSSTANASDKTTLGSTATTSAPTQTPTPFSSLGKSASVTTSAAPVTSTSAQSSSIFNNVGSIASTAPPTTTTGTTTTHTTPATTSTANGLGVSTTLGTSTAGLAPQLSRLKNKTMDEIITRWAGDLSNYQKEFQEQAAKVASWDRLLVENGEKIQKLYNSTFEAERASAAVERQLANVESQQDELSAWLDRFEGDVDRLMAEQIGQGEALQGPDQERERTYKLAEKLAERLDEMGKDLTNMIEEINSASASLTKTSKPEDPLSQIVKVLNGHLSQLQWIDQNAATLQVKVTAAQKAGQGISISGQVDNDAVDDFYRSYMGRR